MIQINETNPDDIIANLHDEITRQEAEIERLRAALGKITNRRLTI